VNDSLRDLVDRCWRELESEQVSGERRLRVSQLPVDTANGPLAAAVDHDRHRHLLVPIGPHQKVRRGLDGPVLLLRKRPLEDEETYQTYADLGCLRVDLNDLFTNLCTEVLEKTRAVPDNPLKALYRALDRWRALFQAVGAPLGAEQLAGLFGELTVLGRLLETDSSAHRLWRGPSGYRHDFTAGRTAVEVKTTTDIKGRRVRIHGLDQLEAPAAGTLQLAWFRLERTPDQGDRIVDLVDQAVRLCDDESVLLGLLAEVGYRTSDLVHYRDVHFSILEERWYEVNAVFPKLTSNDLALAGIPIAVSDVVYTIDLSIEPPSPVEQDQVNDHLITMIREFS
jgi:putative PD-(D/E)XK family protein DUF4420